MKCANRRCTFNNLMVCFLFPLTISVVFSPSFSIAEENCIGNVFTLILPLHTHTHSLSILRLCGHVGSHAHGMVYCTYIVTILYVCLYVRMNEFPSSYQRKKRNEKKRKKQGTGRVGPIHTYLDT